MELSHGLKIWLGWIVLLVISAVVVPYFFLGNVTTIYGAFLYWGLFALAAIITVGIIISKWRD